MTAVVSWLGAPSPAEAMGPVIAMTLVLMPLSLAFLVYEATGSVALTAIVPFFALGLAFPSGQAIIGRFPEVVDSTLIVPFIVASLRVIRGRSTRENALLIVGIVTSIWVIHGLELVTALVVGCGLYAVAVFTTMRASWRAGFARIALVVGATLAGAALVTLLTRLPHVPPPTHIQPSQIIVATKSAPVKSSPYSADDRRDRHHQPRRTRALCHRRDHAVDSSQDAVGPGCTDPADPDDGRRPLPPPSELVLAPRLSVGRHRPNSRVQYWLIPLVLGAGLLSLADVLRRLSRTRRLWVIVSIAAVAVVAIAFVVRHPLGRLWTYVISTNTVYLYPLGVFNRLAQLRPWIHHAGDGRDRRDRRLGGVREAH